MTDTPKPITIRDIETFEELQQLERLEKEVWQLDDRDVTPLTLLVAVKEAGNIMVGAFNGGEMAGFAFGFLGRERGRAIIHSHMLAVRDSYRDRDLGFRLKLAQRDRALAMGIREMTWTFDPLQGRNAHLNFAKLGVISESYREDFYGPETSSVLHRNSTDRLWVRWLLSTRRVAQRIQGQSVREESLELLANVAPLVRFNGDGRPVRADLAECLARQRVVIEIPSEILAVEQKDIALAREWRAATRWAFTEALKSGFFVAEFCALVRGKQGPGAYVLQKGPVTDYIPDAEGLS